MSTTAIQVKCYLLKDNSKLSHKAVEKAVEIRRFNLSIEPINGLYERLLDKIQTHFKDVFATKQDIKSYWLDEENEFIGFSSDSEFQYAMDIHTAVRLSRSATPYGQTVNNHVFKVYITKNTPHSHKIDDDSTGSGAANTACHRGVTCDGCNAHPIYGDRFKCAGCADYDLCSACESNGVHKESGHKFIKLSAPNFFRTFMPKCRRFQENFTHHTLPTATQHIPFVNDPEQLKKFGEYFKNVLEPFGIDVDYYVDSLSGGAKKEEEKKATKTEEKTPESTVKVDEKKTEEPQQAAASAASAPSMSPQGSLYEDIKMDEVKTSTRPDDEGFNFIDLERELPNLISQIASAATSVSNGTPAASPVSNDKCKVIEDTLKQLSAMGFTDENGWLTNLVTAKNCNINAVLDTMRWGDKQ